MARLSTLGDMKRLKKIGIVFAAVIGLYLLLPLVVFDFSSVATPWDEENFGSQQVAMTFVVWKPLCIAYDKAHGYALPAEWRQHEYMP
jgi:hypothetical protein